MDAADREVVAERRKRWGCDRETEAPQLFMECAWCPPRDYRDECEHCTGTGRVAIHRCPNAFARGAAMDICHGASLLTNGLLPVAGGWADQSATFVDAITLVMTEKASYDEERRRKAMRDAKAKR